MLRKLALVAGCVMSIASAGCRNDNNNFMPADLAVGGGGGDGGSNDMSMMKMYTAATPHDIDTGMVTKGTNVKLSGMVVVAPVSKFFSKSSATCKYEIIVQDPQCTTPPCGIVIETNGMHLPVMDAGSSSCPTPPNGGTFLDPLAIGDNVDITGAVDTFADSMNAAIVQHSVTADGATKTSGTATITAMPVSDNTQFVVHVTGQWMMYEGTVITISGGGGKLTISSVDTGVPYNFHTMPGNTSWGTDYHFSYKNGMDSDAGQFPQQGLQYTSITGVVDTLFGGAVKPRLISDYTP
jgi:hypothetical protein